MNHIYKLRWDPRTGALVAVSEVAAGRGKCGGRALTVARAVSAALLAMAAQEATSADCSTPITSDRTITTAETFSGAVPCRPSNSAQLTISNTGVLHATTGSNGAAVQVVGGATAGAITNNGTIIGTTRAIVIDSGGTLSGGLQNNGVITGVNVALDVSGVASNIVNNASGTIIGTGGYWAVHFGGAVSTTGITNSGLIDGQAGVALSVEFSTVSGDILNAGQISALRTGLSVDSSLVQGTISNTGTFTGGSGIGVFESTVTEDVINDGQIITSGSALNIGGATVAGAIHNTGLLNSTSGTALVISSSAVSGGIHNSGTIIGSSVGLAISGGPVSSGVTNSGTIAAGGNAIELGYYYSTTSGSSSSTYYVHSGATISGGVTNTGSIASDSADGIRVNGSDITGDLVNQASISAPGGAGIGFQPGITGSSSNYVRNTLTGSIINNGTIAGSSGVRLLQTDMSGFISNAAAATIIGSDSGLEIRESTVAQGITNAGVISGGSGDGIFIGGGEVGSSSIGADIINSGTITGDNGLVLQGDVTVTGNIVNTALIQGTGVAGIAMSGASVSGAVQNSSQIAGGAYGIRIRSGSHLDGGVENLSGATISGGTGLRIEGNSTVGGGITNGGVIQGTAGSGGVSKNVILAGGVHNQAAATISGADPNPGNGITVEQGASVSGGIANAGLIDGDNGILVSSASVAGGITNASGGVISGVVAGVNVFNGATVTGGMANSGSISGLFGVKVDASNVVGTITNQSGGVINGTNAGVSVDGAATVTGGIVNTGRISGVTRSLSLTNTGAAFTVNNTGTLSGDAELGINTLDLNGNGARLTGNTTGSGATVNANGEFTSEGTFDVYTFNIGNTGVFHIAHAVTVAGGFNNDGVLTVPAGYTAQVNGNYTQTAQGTLRIALVDTSSNYGKLAVSGNVTLAAGTAIDVDVAGAPTLAVNERVNDVILAGGTLTSSTINVTDNSYLFNFTSDTSRDAHAVDLVIVAAATSEPEPDPDPTPTPEEPVPGPAPSVVTAALQSGNDPGLGAARVFDALIASGDGTSDMRDVISTLGRFETAQEVSDALRQTLPLMTGAGAMASTNALHSMNRIIQSRVESNRGLSSGDEFVAGEEYIWIRPFASHGKQGDRDGVTGFESKTAGLAVGLDGAANDAWRLGGVLTYADSSVESNGSVSRQRTDVKTYEAVGYASYNLDPATDINYQIDIGRNSNDGRRHIGFGGLNRTATSSYDSLAIHASAGIGRALPLSAVTNITPSVRLDYTRVKSDGYTEAGAGALSLAVGSSTYDELLVSTDVKLAHNINDRWKLVSNVAVAYDTTNDAAQSTSAFVGGGTVFVTDGLEPSPWIGRLGVGLLSTNAVKGAEWQIRYDAEARDSGYLSQTVSARFRKAFN